VNRWQDRWGRPRAKQCARGALALLTVAAVALATVLGGQRYLYCLAMDQIMTEATCACAQSHADAEEQLALRVDNRCFEVRFLGRLVSFTVADALAVPSTPLVAILAVPSLAVPPSSALLAGADHPIRAGPFSPTANRAKLMVFLT
jgi:hypothetical protein